MSTYKGRRSRPPRYLTPDQAARVLNVSARTILRLVARGELRAYRVGKYIRIPKKVLKEFLKANRTGPPPQKKPTRNQLTKKQMKETQEILDRLL